MIAPRRSLSVALVLVGAVVCGGCQSSAQTGVLAGAGLGALMGQAIGGNTAGTLIGAAAGAGVGYIIGNEVDRQHANELTRQNTEEIARLQGQLDAQQRGGATSTITRPSTDRPTHNEVGPLGNTRWMLINVQPRDAAPPHASILLDFRPNGRLLTTTTGRDGSVASADECFRVVGGTLIVNRPGYLINARFRIDGEQLVITNDDFSAVFQRLPS